MRRKVLIVGPVLETGGVTRYVNDLLKFRGKYNYVLFDNARPIKKIITPVEGYLHLINAGILRFIIGGIVTLKNMLFFPFYLLFKNPDIVHICGVSYAVFWENIYYTLWSKIFNIQTTIHYLGALDLFYNGVSNFEKNLIIKGLRLYNRHIFLHNQVALMFKDSLKLSEINVICSNVELDTFMNVGVTRTFNKNRITVLFVGGVDPYRKGITDILKAIKIIIKKNKEIAFIFSGGESVKNLKIEWENDGLGQYIQYVGTVSDEQKLVIYNDSDLLILPSYNEGLPYVIIEAMASGLPIIASSVGGIPEVVEHGINGFIIKPGEYEKLTEYILFLADNYKLRKEISSKNRMKVLNNFSKNSAFNKLELIFDNLLNSK